MFCFVVVVVVFSIQLRYAPCRSKAFFLEVKIEESQLVDKTVKINLKLLRVQKEVMACAERKENFITFNREPKLNHIRQAIENTN